MICYALKCAHGHSFDSWFQSAEAFDKLAAAGLVTCSVCQSGDVSKAIMAPRVSSARAQDKPLSAPASPAEQALVELRQKVEAEADYVGTNFAIQAREMHEGTTPERSIYGETNADEARKLLEDGVPVIPLPFGPNRKAN